MKPIHQRIFMLVIFLLGILVFVVFSHMRPLFSTNVDPYLRIGLVLFLLVLIRFCGLNDNWIQFQSIFIAFLIAMIAMTIDLYLPTGSWILSRLNIQALSPFGVAIDKLDSSLILIVLIIVLNKFSGGSLVTIGLKREKKSNLRVGIIALLISLILAIPLSGLFGAVNLSLERIIAWSPFIAIFVFANAFNEELLFRSLFIFKLKPIYGKTMANLILVLPFVLHHTGVGYTTDQFMFFVILTPLSIVWGHLTLKTGNLYNALLFHAGTDIPIALALFSQL